MSKSQRNGVSKFFFGFFCQPPLHQPEISVDSSTAALPLPSNIRLVTLFSAESLTAFAATHGICHHNSAYFFRRLVESVSYIRACTAPARSSSESVTRWRGHSQAKPTGRDLIFSRLRGNTSRTWSGAVLFPKPQLSSQLTTFSCHHLHIY